MLRSSVFWAVATPKLLRHQKRFVRQSDRTDCGVACALTVLNMLGQSADPVGAVEYLDGNRTGSSLDDLRRYFEEERGLAAKSLAAPASTLGRLRGQIILHMRQQHYVVLLQTGKSGILVFDPAVGTVIYPHADFAALYSGHLLQVDGGRAANAEKLPAPYRSEQLSGRTAWRGQGLGLFFVGVASRLLECAILLCLVAALFLVLNHASFPSLLAVFAVAAGCGVILLLARQVRADSEDGLNRSKQSRLWRRILRTSFRGRDLHGFRGRFEKDVSGAVRQGMVMGIPQRTQLPGALGSLLGMTALLCFLSPVIGAIHLALFVALMLLLQLDAVQVCRRSIRKGIGRYTKLSHSMGLPNGVVLPDFIGEIAKWSVIGWAGYSVLLADLPPVALMFWILTGMQIVPLDFRRAQVIMPILGNAEPISDLVGAEVPTRRQRVLGSPELKVRHDDPNLLVDGISTLTATLQQPDLTVREQRLIMADIVRLALSNLSSDLRPDISGSVRVFGPGQDATQSDFEHLMITQKAGNSMNLPVPVNTRDVLDQGREDPVLRNLFTCAPGDFPVFWDFRNKMAVAEIQKRLAVAGLPYAGHLTMKRLTVIKAA